MKAIVVDQSREGPASWRERALDYREVEGPVPGPGEVRIRVHATAVNRADLLQVVGLYPPPPGASTIPGMEAAGEVDAVGTGVSNVAVGDRVCALLAGGGYAEQVVCPAGHVLPVPESLELEHAAALPEVLTTAYLNLYLEGALDEGESALVHAGASGVGTAAIQLAQAFGNPCYVTGRNDEKLERCMALGASGVVNPTKASFAEAVKGWTDKRGVDVILDCAGGAYFPDNLKSLAPRGRLVLIGNLSGEPAELDLNRFFVKRQRVIGSVLRSRGVDEKTEILTRMTREVWPMVTSGAIQPVVDRVVDLPRLAEAFEAVDANQTFGKVVLRVP